MWQNVASYLGMMAVSALFTYFVTSIVSQNNARKLVSEAVTKHEVQCDGNHRLQRIEDAVIFIIVKSGWSLQEAGLK